MKRSLSSDVRTLWNLCRWGGVPVPRRVRFGRRIGATILIGLAVGIPLVTECKAKDSLEVFPFAAFSVFWAMLTGATLSSREGVWAGKVLRWLLLKPVSTRSLVVVAYGLPCVVASLLLLGAYGFGTVSGVFERGVLHGRGASLALVLTPATFGLVGFGMGSGLYTFLVTAVVTVGALGATAWRCPPWAEPHAWIGLCFACSITLGCGLYFLGISGLRRNAGATGRRVRNRSRVRSVRASARPRPAFRDAEAAELWRHWRRAWLALPLVLVGAEVLGFLGAGWEVLLCGILRDESGMSLGELVSGSAVVGGIVGAVISGALAVLLVLSKKTVAPRTLSPTVDARCLFKGALQAIGVTAALSAMLAVSWEALASRDHAIRTAWSGTGPDLIQLLAYILLGIWAATWGLFLVNRIIVSAFCVGGVVVYGAVGCALVHEARYGTRTELPDALLETLGVAFLVVGAVSFSVYGGRALYLAWRRGLLGGRGCVCAVLAWLVLLAVPLAHCPTWLQDMDVLLRGSIVVWLAAGVVAPVGAIPLLCHARRQPAMGLLGWNGYSPARAWLPERCAEISRLLRSRA